MVDQLVGPLSHLADELDAAGNEQVRIGETPFLTRLSVRIEPGSAAVDAVGAALGAALPARPNTLVRGNGLRLLWLGPDEWLVVGPADQQGRLEQRIRQAIGAAFGSVTDVSAQRTTVMVSGPMTLDLLAGGCALDLDADVFTHRHCAQTTLAKAPVLLYREADAMAVMVQASFADHLARWLLDAAIEYRRRS